jgi:uncharacterized protein (DUF427 family)
MSGVEQASGNGDSVAKNGKPIESVWDYPRPPRLDPVEWRIRVFHGDTLIVDAPRAVRVLETSQPPAYYVEKQYVNHEYLEQSALSTYCEWKGPAAYVNVVANGEVITDAGWYYPNPTASFAPITDHFAFYAQKLRCMVDDEPVDPNDGSFYGGWITNNVTGPFKGAPGTLHW